MQAKLITRCGCSKSIDVPEPPPMLWRMLLDSKLSFMEVINAKVPPNIEYRDFEYTETKRMSWGQEVAIYKEK